MAESSSTPTEHLISASLPIHIREKDADVSLWMHSVSGTQDVILSRWANHPSLLPPQLTSRTEHRWLETLSKSFAYFLLLEWPARVSRPFTPSYINSWPERGNVWAVQLNLYLDCLAVFHDLCLYQFSEWFLSYLTLLALRIHAVSDHLASFFGPSFNLIPGLISWLPDLACHLTPCSAWPSRLLTQLDWLLALGFCIFLLAVVGSSDTK